MNTESISTPACGAPDLTGVRKSAPVPPKAGRFFTRLMWIFTFIACAALAVNLAFLLAMTFQVVDWETAFESGYSSIGQILAVQTLSASRDKFTVVSFVNAVGFGAIIYLFIRRVVRPLGAIEANVREMTRGNLNLNMPTSSDEVGRLGASITDFGVNVQEVLLLTATATGNAFTAVEQIESALKTEQNIASASEIHEHVETLRKNLDVMNIMLQEFEFYHTHFDGRKVVGEQPAGEIFLSESPGEASATPLQKERR